MGTTRKLMMSGAALAAVATTAVATGVRHADATPAGTNQQVRVSARVEIDVLDQTCDNTGSTIEISGIQHPQRFIQA